MVPIGSTFSAKVANIRARWRALTRIQRWVTLGIFLLIAAAAIFSLRGNEETTSSVERLRQVEVKSISELAGDSSPLSLVGKVSSLSEATIRSEASGKIRVYRKLGDYIVAGTAIAEFENSGERAAVLSAEGVYQAALAAREIAGISRGSAGNSLEEARTSAVNAIKSVYTTLDDTVRQKTDVMWNNPQERDAKLIPTISDAKLVIDLEKSRVEIEDLLVARENTNTVLATTSELAMELSRVETEARHIAKYFDDLSLALSRAIPDAHSSSAQIEGWKTVTSISRQSVNGALASITASRNALQAANAQAQIAEKNAGSGANVAAADAQVTSALGALRGAQSRLEKTIVRSPISGTINSLSVETGDFVSPFSEVAVISNNGALEIVAYVTEDDARILALGDLVSIEGNAKGVVTRIAPALDPRTRKIEVKIGITDGKGLVNGQSVGIEIARKARPAGKDITQIALPISAVKLTPQGSFVFTVTASSTLASNPVTLGTLLGDRVIITAGLTKEMDIVVDARGLKDGIPVEVKE